MILPIILYGSQLLRKKCNEAIAEKCISGLIENMYETLNQAGGIGLAAPQVGLLKRILIIDAIVENSGNRIRKGFINPKILEFSDDTIYYNEGCLSIPGIREDTLRPEKIWVKYLDETFSEKFEELNGIESRVFQHEYDHLEGILFIDRLSVLRKKLIRSKLNQIQKIKTIK